MIRPYVQVEYKNPVSLQNTMIEGYLTSLSNDDYFKASIQTKTLAIVPALNMAVDADALNILEILIPLEWVISVYPTTPTLGTIGENQRD